MARRNAAPSGLVLSSRPGAVGDGVILHGEGEIGPPHRPVGLGELFERMGTVQLMQHVPVDIDEIAAIGAARHEMGIPDLVEQGLRHGGFQRCGASGREHLGGRNRTQAAREATERRVGRARFSPPPRLHHLPAKQVDYACANPPCRPCRLSRCAQV